LISGLWVPWGPPGVRGWLRSRDAVSPDKEVTGFEGAQSPRQGKEEKRSRICCPHTLVQLGTVLGIPRN
jgi:hypothetical protein